MSYMEEVTLIGIRIHVPNNERHQIWYQENIFNWLKFRKYTIQRYVVGSHINTGNEHIHIHVETQGGKKLSNPIATMKRDYELGKILTEYRCKEDMKEFIPIHKGEYKGRINISIQMTQLNISQEKDIERFLQYPMKEGIVVATNLPQEIATQLECNAKAEYATALAKQEKIKTKEKKNLSDWQEFVNHLDKEDPKSIRQAYRIAILYYIEKYDKPPTGKVIADNTERYSIKRGLLSTEQLVEKYMAFY